MVTYISTTSLRNPPTRFASDVQITYTKLMVSKLHQNLIYIPPHAITAVLNHAILQCGIELYHIVLIVVQNDQNKIDLNIKIIFHISVTCHV